MTKAIDWEEMSRKLEAIAAEEGVDLTDISDVHVLEKPTRIKFKLESKSSLPEKTWKYQQLLAKMKYLYKQSTKDYDGWPTWDRFAKKHSLYYWARMNQDKVSEKDEEIILKKLFGGGVLWLSTDHIQD